DQRGMYNGARDKGQMRAFFDRNDYPKDYYGSPRKDPYTDQQKDRYRDDRRPEEQTEQNPLDYSRWFHNDNPNDHTAQLVQSMQNSKGWLLFIRFDNRGLETFIHALQVSSSTQGKHGGFCVGIAASSEVIVMEGGDSWISPNQRKTNFAVVVMWFASYFDAKEWLEMDHRIRQPSFPEPYGYECIAIPMNPAHMEYGKFDPSLRSGQSVTFLITEYPSIQEPAQFPGLFLNEFANPARQVMRDNYGLPYVAVVGYSPSEMDPYKKANRTSPNVRCARHIRKGWIRGNGILCVSIFPDQRFVNNVYLDSK
ncbi:hypothetical protein ACJMK2_009222, partial [Sinanodonta woodiana]